MPTGALRSALEELTQGLHSPSDLSHGRRRPPTVDFSSLAPDDPFLQSLGRKVRVSSFLDVEAGPRRRRRPRTAFTTGGGTRKGNSLEGEVVEDHDPNEQSGGGLKKLSKGTTEEESPVGGNKKPVATAKKNAHGDASHSAADIKKAQEEQKKKEMQLMQKRSEVSLQGQEVESQEVLTNLERKVENRLVELRQNTEKKVDDFFKTMREAYGVPYAHPQRGGGGSEGGPGAGDDNQAWEGAKVRVKMPDLPAGKKAIIQLERQQSIDAGGEPVDSQAEALKNLVGRLNGVMRKLSGQHEPDPNVEAHDNFENPVRPAEPGSMGDLYNKVKAIQDHLTSVAHKEDMMPAPTGNALAQMDQEHLEEVGAAMRALAKQPMPSMNPHCYKLPWPAQKALPEGEEGQQAGGVQGAANTQQPGVTQSGNGAPSGGGGSWVKDPVTGQRVG